MAIVINGSGTVTGISVGGLPDDIVDSGTLADDAVVTAAIAADAVTAAKIGDDVIDSEHYAAGSIDTAHIGTDQITRAIMPAGAILQAVQSIWTGGVTSTSTTLTATSLTASITPTASSSKILIIISGGDQTMAANDVGCLNSIFRTISGGSATNLASQNNTIQVSYEAVGGSWLSMPQCMVHLDSPNTTSAITYAQAFATRDSGNTSKLNMFGAQSTMQLLEIAG